MKICYLADVRSVHTRRWVEYFAKEHEIDLITLAYTKKEDTFVPEEVYKKMGVQVHKVSKKMPFLLFAPFKIRRLIKKIKPDIVHAHYVTQYGFCGAFSGFHPLIISPWGSDIAVDPEKSIVKRWLVEYALERADAVSGEGKVMKSQLMTLKCDEDKIAPLRIASVNTNEFHPSKRSESLRKAMGAENDFLVLNARPLIPLYHVDVFIHAIPFVIEKIPNVKFIIISRTGKEPMKHQIEELARKLAIEDEVICIGVVPHSKMPEYLASVDLYVDSLVSVSAMDDESSIDETAGIGTTILEAMSCGVPVLIANKNRIDKYPYRTYYPLDSKDLAKKIIELLLNENLRKRIRNDAREFAILTADRKVVMEKWNNFYFDFYSKYSD
ncbi:D-inositol-3-phosphate glycosyltransferase [ANME-1 cluster archaeon GoMg2]|nr:D-inositol-3-phosphate glycosyltransferase [ANME-1 cluster archaeon GoMg2]